MIADADPMRGPPTQASGGTGVIRVAGLRAGVLTSWRIVFSPTAVRTDAAGQPVLNEEGMPIPAYTLFGEGRLLGLFGDAVGVSVVADLTPATPLTRIGRPKPKPASPFRLVGKVFELTARRIVIASGEIGPTEG